MAIRSRSLVFLALTCVPLLRAQEAPIERIQRDSNVAIPMRDSITLMADILRPAGDGPFPVLGYRTPYDLRAAVTEYSIFRKAVERGYAVVIQDVRGRYGSRGE